MSEKSIAIVVPCFNEQDVLPETIPMLIKVIDGLVAAGKISDASSIYFIDDGSSDDTWSLLKEASDAYPRTVVGVKLSRNKGHQNALYAGLAVTCEDAVISIDADLQDDVAKISEMVDAYFAGYDVVYGVRSARDSDSFFKRFTAEGYYTLLNKMGVDVVFNHADFRLMSRRAIDALLEYRESQLFLRGMVREVGFNATTVEYERGTRLAGETKYSLRKMVTLAWDGISSFSSVPLRLITLLGISASGLSMLMICWVLVVKLATDKAVPGWTSILLPLLLIGSVQLLSIGVLGEYLAKLYNEVKGRPRYHIEEVYKNKISKDA